jgi:hypothetical protein
MLLYGFRDNFFEGCAKLLEIIGMDKVKTVPILQSNPTSSALANVYRF